MSTSITDKRPPEIDRLPRRLKEYVNALERVVSAWEGLSAQQKDSSVYIESYDRGTKKFLPEGAEVTFLLRTGGPGPHERIKIRKDQHGTLEIRSEICGLAVYPDVSNVVRIGPRSRS